MPHHVHEVSAQDAFDMLQTEHHAQLIDVRTTAEWNSVGIPKSSDLKTQFIEWMRLPQMNLNQDFANELQIAAPEKDTPLFFLCKAGGRSHAAAEAALGLGYTNCYNILGGFEGSETHKGWAEAGLPMGNLSA